ncbi:1-acyl-sn-glycerol-3-phosphate acyltransferase [Streptomyces sp. P38-E01]|uniref:1-acyl-sn-glycerol-3-phosphate acyltransferase n=1 Tax=Streptomyces tardus TaxID=2780544 RepID=A0A949N7J9_9ACTN|nr:lysophospholipid acyltransferase family protein [Streptomyces tardus]MBU7600202.1 1-acyl-sn-glycerol-3-phosphate acyltransferase [Streptomyces tardus]
MAELVYPPVVGASRTLFKVLDLRFDIQGTEHIPRRGGAVLVSNHIGYLDFVFAGLAARPAKRLVRFMAKDQVFKHKVSGPLMRAMKHIPVDRSAGQDSYRHAVRSLKAGEIVGVFPEATISPSFTLKQFKSGAVRMAQEAGVPVLPLALWGTQRLWTKGRKRDFGRNHFPITIRVGEQIPAPADESPAALTDLMRDRMQELLETAQEAYPAKPSGPDDTWWLPAHLGGSAPPAPGHTAA